MSTSNATAAEGVETSFLLRSPRANVFRIQQATPTTPLKSGIQSSNSWSRERAGQQEQPEAPGRQRTKASALTSTYLPAFQLEGLEHRYTQCCPQVPVEFDATACCSRKSSSCPESAASGKQLTRFLLHKGAGVSDLSDGCCAVLRRAQRGKRLCVRASKPGDPHD